MRPRYARCGSSQNQVRRVRMAACSVGGVDASRRSAVSHDAQPRLLHPRLSSRGSCRPCRRRSPSADRSSRCAPAQPRVDLIDVLAIVLVACCCSPSAMPASRSARRRPDRLPTALSTERTIASCASRDLREHGSPAVRPSRPRSRARSSALTSCDLRPFGRDRRARRDFEPRRAAALPRRRCAPGRPSRTSRRPAPARASAPRRAMRPAPRARPGRAGCAPAVPPCSSRLRGGDLRAAVLRAAAARVRLARLRVVRAVFVAGRRSGRSRRLAGFAPFVLARFAAGAGCATPLRAFAACLRRREALGRQHLAQVLAGEAVLDERHLLRRALGDRLRRRGRRPAGRGR